MFKTPFISNIFKIGFLLVLMVMICNASTSQNIGLYGTGYLSFNNKYGAGTGAGLYFHEDLGDYFNLGIDVHVLQNTENKQDEVSYCHGDPCAARFTSDKDIDSTVSHSTKLTHYIWKIALEPTWKLTNKETKTPLLLNLGLDLGIGEVGRRAFFQSGYQNGDLFTPIERFNLSLGFTINAQSQNFPSENLNCFFKLNPEYYLTKDDVLDAPRFMTRNMGALQAKIGILYSFDGS